MRNRIQIRIYNEYESETLILRSVRSTDVVPLASVLLNPISNVFHFAFEIAIPKVMAQLVGCCTFLKHYLHVGF